MKVVHDPHPARSCFARTARGDLRLELVKSHAQAMRRRPIELTQRTGEALGNATRTCMPSLALVSRELENTCRGQRVALAGKGKQLAVLLGERLQSDRPFIHDALRTTSTPACAEGGADTGAP